MLVDRKQVKKTAFFSPFIKLYHKSFASEVPKSGKNDIVPKYNFVINVTSPNVNN